MQLLDRVLEAHGGLTHRGAYTRGPDRRPITDMLMMHIDLSDVAFEKEAA